MAFDSGNFLIIGGSGDRDQRVYIQERLNNNGQIGKVVTFADGKGDAKEIAERYIERGFDPNKVIINGQLASDVFQSENSVKNKVEAPESQASKSSFVSRLVNSFAWANLLASKRNNSLQQANEIANQQMMIHNQMAQQMHELAMQSHMTAVQMTTPGMGFV